MFQAASSGNIEEIKRLLKEGADVNVKNNSGWTALMFAAQYSNASSSYDTAKFLLDAGADINVKNMYEETALMWAAKYSNTTSSYDTVKLLLDAGADINVKNMNGWTALMFASLYSNLTSSYDTVKLLLDAGANVNLKDNYGRTTLVFAVENSNTSSSTETVKLLLEYGADPFVTIRSTPEAKDVIGKAIWDRFYSRDLETAKKCSKSSPLPKDVWEIILLHKRLQQLCKNLSSPKNKEVLKYFALTLQIPITPDMSKAKLCKLISTYLVYERIHSEKREEMVKRKMG